MNAEQIFYATEEDMVTLLEVFKDFGYDNIEKESSHQYLAYFGNEFVQILTSVQYGNILNEGRISRKTLEKGEDATRADNLFKEMRQWLKENYTCNKMLTYREDKNQTKEDARLSTLPAKCISLNALQLYKKGAVILKEHTGSVWVEFPADL